MKKILVLSLLIIFITGCRFNFNIINNSKENKGRLYNIVTLNDKGVNMFQGIVPEGWTATISSENIVNSSYPFVETVTIVNPENTAKISILSQHSYTENKKYNEGVNTDYYTTYLHQMDASTYLDFFMNSVYNGATFVKENDVDSKILEQLQLLHNMKVEQGKQDAIKINSSQYGVDVSVDGVSYTSARREYQNGLNYFEASTSVSAIGTKLKASLSALLDSYAVQWYMPYVIVYEGETKEAFDDYYDDYQFIIANSNFTLDYYQMVEYVSSAIVNAYTSYYNAKSQAALNAMNDYIDSNYSSTSSQSTNDKVMEMWDDVIKEVDSYKLEDGSTLKTSIFNETVAQNGNEIYIGSKAGIPNGFNIVGKGY